MSKKDLIIVLPNPHLRQKSRKVSAITPEAKRVIADMKEATLDWEASRKHEVGVALAAVQIDQLFKVVVIRNDFENKEDKTFSVFINPEIIKLEGEVEDDFEGCLSVADVYGKVPRHTKIRLKALDENGQEIRVRAEGFLARVFQHEIDHTNGVLFVDHIKDMPEAFFRLKDDGKLEKLPYEQVSKAGIFR
jgi:peptide deformylase